MLSGAGRALVSRRAVVAAAVAAVHRGGAPRRCLHAPVGSLHPHTNRGPQRLSAASAGEAPPSSRPMTTVPRVGVGIVCLRSSRGSGGRGVEVLMIQRGTEPGIGTWSFPGGKLELGETIVGCAIRELKEETGITLRCQTAPPSPELSHLGSPLALSSSLDTPVAFAAADAVYRNDDGTVAFHYAIIEVAGVPEDPDAPVKASDDAAAAAWVEIDRITELDHSLNCDLIAQEAARRFRIQ